MNHISRWTKSIKIYIDWITKERLDSIYYLCTIQTEEKRNGEGKAFTFLARSEQICEQHLDSAFVEHIRYHAVIREPNTWQYFSKFLKRKIYWTPDSYVCYSCWSHFSSQVNGRFRSKQICSHSHYIWMLILIFNFITALSTQIDFSVHLSKNFAKHIIDYTISC